MDRSSPRLRGRAGMARRARVLARDPVCQECIKLDIYRPSDEADHIIPLHRGGPDHEDNMQGLCTPCHEAKTLTEQGGRVTNHPEWLEPSLIPITTVCGPPCSGKSTHARTHAKADHLIIDLDDLMLALDPTYQPWTGNRERLDDAIRQRNRLLGSLARPTPYTAAWFIVSAPTEDERRWWQSKLGGSLLLLNPGIAECKRRAVARGTPGALQGVDDWTLSAQLPWQRNRDRVAISEDGWPMSGPSVNQNF